MRPERRSRASQENLAPGHQRERDDVALLIAIREGDERAMRELHTSSTPLLLAQARKIGVPAGEREEMVTTFLDDAIIRLATSTAPAPRSLTAFLSAAFRNYAATRRRGEGRYRRHAADECATVGNASEEAVTAACSEFALSAVRGADETPEGAETSTAAAALIAHLLSGCSTAELDLLVWNSHRVPLRDIAAWLGISYTAAKMRLARLRERLVSQCTDAVAALTPADRVRMQQVLARAGIIITVETNTTRRIGGEREGEGA